jgi:hypothetical protein
MIAIETTARHAYELLDLLVDTGPLTSRQCCEKLGWSQGRFSAALRYARENLCAELGIAVPAPTPASGWVYQATTEWQPVEQGAAHSLGLVESRLLSIHRDVDLILPHLVRGSKEWRRANFLHKHLAHLTSTLKEINGDG